MTFISAADARYCYAGRIDFSLQARPVVVWQGSRIRLDFSGAIVAIQFGPAVEQNAFDVTVDERTEVIAVPAGGGWSYVWPHVLGAVRHQLILFKRSEAAAGQVGFVGVEVADGAQVWAPTDLKHKGRMEFFGDSVMVGACNEDGATDQWEDRSTHNHALSYPSLTATALSADVRCMAVSGMGIATGYVEVKAAQVWDRLYPTADSVRADLEAWQPDVVLINFGENDDSFTRNQQQPFPTGYTAGYVALVKAIRAAYPRAQLVLLRGGMFGGSQSGPLREAWEEVVKEVEATDVAVSHMIFTHWSSNHPRVSDHRAMAEELVAWLKLQAFMQLFQ